MCIFTIRRWFSSQIKVENFTVSMSDGRVLCYLLHYYHPCLVKLEDICQETTQTCNPYAKEDDSFDDDDSLIMETWVSSHDKGIVYTWHVHKQIRASYNALVTSLLQVALTSRVRDASLVPDLLINCSTLLSCWWQAVYSCSLVTTDTR